jgi:hypothetical protein
VLPHHHGAGELLEKVAIHHEPGHHDPIGVIHACDEYPVFVFGGCLDRKQGFSITIHEAPSVVHFPIAEPRAFAQPTIFYHT